MGDITDSQGNNSGVKIENFQVKQTKSSIQSKEKTLETAEFLKSIESNITKKKSSVGVQVANMRKLKVSLLPQN